MRLLDLFCGAGGAAMGYHRAGFEVVGVDIKPQPHYPFEFHQADALTYPLDGFDVIHASPPCQRYAPVTRWRGKSENHPDLVALTHSRLRTSNVPWIIENVPNAPLHATVMLCGSHFGLNVVRHRIFQTSWGLCQLMPSCRHYAVLAFEHKDERAFADAMGCTWMTAREAREAIPPAYTEWIGRQLLHSATNTP